MHLFVLIVTMLCEPGRGITLAVFLYIIMVFLLLPFVQEESNTVQASFNKIYSLLALFFASVITLAILILAMRVHLKQSALHLTNMIVTVPAT